jgi:hypothetical protein
VELRGFRRATYPASVKDLTRCALHPIGGSHHGKAILSLRHSRLASYPYADDREPQPIKILYFPGPTVGGTKRETGCALGDTVHVLEAWEDDVE